MKKAVVIVIVCAVFGGSLSVGKAAVRAPSPAAQSRFSVFSLLSSMELPLALADTLFASGVPLYPEFKKRPEAKDRDDRSQTRSGVIRISDTGIRTVCRNDTSKNLTSSFVPADVPYQCMAPPGPPFIEMIAAFLLAYMGLLRRSNLPGETIALFARYCPVTL